MAAPLAKKVLLIGWDAADWKLINPLLDAGKLPCLESLINGGVMGNLSTLRPVLSPLLWTSIATGKRADKHGILDFVEPDPYSGGVRPTSSTSRKVKAIWNILTQRGLRSHVVGWFAGHPAEPINGVSVSPLFPLPVAAAPCPWPLPEGSIHPIDLRETFAELRVHPTELAAEELLPFIPRAAEIDQESDPGLISLATILAECCSIHNAATWILENQPWDFLTVFYNAIDHFCHGFMKYYPPRMPGIEQREFEIYRDVVPAAYRFQDALLGRLLSLAGSDVTVIIVSDHGFHSDDLRPRNIVRERAGNTGWHRPIGVICMKSPGLRKDERIYGANLLDIAPTVLALFGLPVGQDMDGRLLTQAFDAPPQPDWIPSWEDEPGECGMHPADMRMDAAAAQVVIQQFVALGYLDAPTEDAAEAVASSIEENKYNLARVYMDSQRPDEALPLFEELSRAKPLEIRFGLELAQCYVTLRRPEDAKTVLEPYVQRGSQPWADWLLGVIHSETGSLETAIFHLERAEQTNPRLPELHLRLGNTYKQMHRWHDAGRAFERAIQIDGDSASAHIGLASVHLAQRKNPEAAEEALVAVGLAHYMPLGHYFLGIALSRLGEFERAVTAFETALSILPRFVNAHRWLAAVHSQPGGDARKAIEHRRIARELRRQPREQGPK
jgi:tetratricopeptide (TPR) repeat protein